MVNKLEYLKKSISSGKVIKLKRWFISCFGIPVLKPNNDWETDSYIDYDIVTQPDGLYYIEPLTTDDNSGGNKRQLVKIDDFKRGEPLYDFQTFIEVDNTWLPTVPGKTICKIGILVFNAMVVYPAVNSKLGFINPSTPEKDVKLKVTDFENLLASKVRNPDEPQEGGITVQEMLNCVDNMTFLEEIAILINIAATVKTVTPPPNVDVLRKEIYAKYKDYLNDPVKVAEFQNELEKIDDEYLSDDIAAKTILNKKSRTARKKMFLTFGPTSDFVKTSDNNLVIPPLSEGVSTDPEDFPKYINDAREASFSRGASTALAGYSYKILQRSLAGVTISSTPCDTKTGLFKKITQSDYKQLVSRYIKVNGKWSLVDSQEMAKAYTDKTVEVRSTVTCKTPGNMVCYACMSDKYKNIPNGVTNLAADMSNVLLSMFLKKMHGGSIDLIEVELDDLVS